jgi:uncharacterized membrane protein
MEAKAKLLGHPIHQMLIVLPLGLLTTAIVFDIIHFISGNARWTEVAYWLIGAGVVGGLLAAPFGLVDWLSVPAGSRARRIGAWHGLGNLMVVLLFAASWLVRRENPLSPSGAAYLFSFVGGGLAMVTGWLGGELVSRMAIGVDGGAHANAPSSLSGRAPAEQPRQRTAGA